jgi:16S rRNA (adenine1518-N6/adenine1519-N6)-dimethyltransferase
MPNLHTSDALKTYGIRASKSLGQNFLNDSNIVQKIVRTSYPLKGELVLEIGPGLGVLTRDILKEPIQKLFSVEYDQRCVKYLQDNLLPNELERLEIINQDALKLDEKSLIGKDQKLIIISNLPYNISTILLLKWLEEANLFKKLVLMFQKEVAERICSPPNNKQYGILSVLTQFLCITKLEIEVPRSAFFPEPNIDSAVISIIPKKNLEDKFPIYKKLELLCKTVFNKRRKTLRNSISPLLRNPAEALSSICIDANRRPETLSVEEFELIARTLI